MIRLLSKSGCVQCTATSKAMDEVSRIALFATADGDNWPESGCRAGEPVCFIERSTADPTSECCHRLRSFLQ